MEWEREGEIEVIVLDTQMTNEMKQEIVYIVGWSQRRFNTISNDEYLTLLCRTQLPLLKGLSPLIWEKKKLLCANRNHTF